MYCCIETINHYMNESSDVYSCLIDASKAFDRVHWGKHFSILIEKKVSNIFLCLIFDSYIRQKVCVAGVFLNPNTSYSKTELSKARFYLQFSLLYISLNDYYGYVYYIIIVYLCCIPYFWYVYDFAIKFIIIIMWVKSVFDSICRLYHMNQQIVPVILLYLRSYIAWD